MAKDPKPNLLVQIHDLIDESFDLSEFGDLCFRLGVKYDNLAGKNLSDRIRELVLQLDRQQRLEDLLNFCAHLRPKVDWPDLSITVSLDTTPPLITAPKRNPRQIFLSHAGPDAEFAHQLAEDLQLHGWRVWIAPDSIHPGEDWVNAINRGLAESGIFLLALTPDAVNSKWVHSETNVAISLQHQNVVRFIPLDLKAAAAPPLWQAYQHISFQSDYKSGLERLLQLLQPEKMAQVADLYRQLQQAISRQQWALVQSLGTQIRAIYPDYRETELQMTLAQEAEAREKEQHAEAENLYERLQVAVTNSDWLKAIDLANQIEVLVPNYRDVRKLADRARSDQRQDRRDAYIQRLRRVPVWVWGFAVLILSGFVIGSIWALSSINGHDEKDGNLLALPSVTTMLVDAAEENNTPDPKRTQEIVSKPTNTSLPLLESTDEPSRTPTPIDIATPTPTLPPITTSTSTSDIGSTRIRPADDAVMVYVPAGEFMMGGDDGEDNEKSFHEVYLDSYWIDQTEVTNSMYALCVQDGECDQPSELRSFTQNDYYLNPTFADYPVIYVRWQDAQNYCSWAGGRLPTEAEWEKAARWVEETQEARTYPWGEEIDCDHANYNSFCKGDTTAVGSYPDGVSPYGALDMVGNVWEWVADWYADDYYVELAYDNPTGPVTGSNRVLRGGSWYYDVNLTRIAGRNLSNPTFSGVGFRCAQE